MVWKIWNFFFDASYQTNTDTDTGYTDTDYTDTDWSVSAKLIGLALEDRKLILVK